VQEQQLEISRLSFSQWQDTEITQALINRISLAAMVVASPTSEVRINPVTEAARINLVVLVAMAIRTNPAVAMEINPVAMAAKISPAMEEEGQAKTCPAVAVIRMQQTLRKTKMAMETPVIMVPTLRPILLRWPLTKRSTGITAKRSLQELQLWASLDMRHTNTSRKKMIKDSNSLQMVAIHRRRHRRRNTTASSGSKNSLISKFLEIKTACT
jgi:hypothetical protein